jgi:FkbM family methyltransferase
LQVFDTLQFILSHPLNRQRPVQALRRYAHWQVSSRLHHELIFRWIDDSVLAVSHGMTGATGNIYCGLHEFVEMAFLLHLLRSGDLFLDIGANVGSYTILASKVCGARSIAFEPDPTTAVALRRNVSLNGIENLVDVEQIALGAETGEIAFTVGLGTTNHVATCSDHQVQTILIKRADDLATSHEAVLAKLDVEGYEDQVFRGASRMLSSRSLLAVQSESHGPHIEAVLRSFGFGRMFYDPFSRMLSVNPFPYQTTNAIYVRDLPDVRRRLQEAMPRTVLHHRI